jgi:thioredoxin-related protein
MISAALMLALTVSQHTAAETANEASSEEEQFPEWFKISFLDIADDVNEAKTKNKRVILYFYQPDCGTCKTFHRDKMSRAEITQSVKQDFDVVPVNMWGDNEVVDVDGRVFSEKKFATARRGRVTPTLIFLDDQGASIARIFGSSSIPRFKAALRYASTRKDKEMSFDEYIKIMEGMSD